MADLETGQERLADLVLAYARRKGLSARETEVFTRFVLEGKASKEIAAELGIAYPTVKLYWTRIYRKLGCDDAIGALLAFLREAVAVIDCDVDDKRARRESGLGPGLAPGCSRQRLADFALVYARRRALSTRETDVFVRFVLEGKANKEISVELGIAYPTVKVYWTRICAKLDCHDAIGVLLAFLRAAVCHLDQCALVARAAALSALDLGYESPSEPNDHSP